MKRKRGIVLLVLIIIIFTTVGCEKETSKSEVESKFNIIFPEKELREYIKKARKNEDDIDELYKEIVYEPIRGEFTKDTEYTNYDFPEFQHPTKDLDRLEEQLEIFIREDVVNLAKETLEKCDSFLFSEGTTVYIWPFVSDDIYFDGGFTQLDGKILVYINPIISGWKKSFSNILGREYYRSICMDRRSEEDFTMLEYLLFEGRGEAFADTVYPGSQKPTTSPLPAIKEKEMWDEIKGNLSNMNKQYQKDIMLGDCKNSPTFCGYRIGYNIMQEFIKNNPDVTIEEWTDMDAKEILERSKYDKSLEGTESKFRIVFLKETVRDWIKTSSKFSDELEKNLKNPKIFIEVENEVISLVEEVLEKCDNVLPNKGATVYVWTGTGRPGPRGLRFEGWGVSNSITVYVNPMYDDWDLRCSEILAHEYHHSVRLEKRSCGSLLNVLIAEGQAVTFQEIIYPDAKIVPTGAGSLTITKEKEMWDEIKENLNSFDPTYQDDIMFGGIKRIPTFCGYRIGYSIMQEFIKNNPDVSVDEWTYMDAKEILDRSGYEESLEKRLEEYLEKYDN